MALESARNTSSGSLRKPAAMYLRDGSVVTYGIVHANWRTASGLGDGSLGLAANVAPGPCGFG